MLDYDRVYKMRAATTTTTTITAAAAKIQVEKCI